MGKLEWFDLKRFSNVSLPPSLKSHVQFWSFSAISSCPNCLPLILTTFNLKDIWRAELQFNPKCHTFAKFYLLSRCIADKTVFVIWSEVLNELSRLLTSASISQSSIIRQALCCESDWCFRLPRYCDCSGRLERTIIACLLHQIVSPSQLSVAVAMSGHNWDFSVTTGTYSEDFNSGPTDQLVLLLLYFPYNQSLSHPSLTLVSLDESIHSGLLLLCLWEEWRKKS